MKIAIVLNSTRVTSGLTEKFNIPELALKHNVYCDVFIKEPHELESFFLSLHRQRYDAYIVGGGDGTVRTAAQALINQDIPLAILPLGSFNFLAKTLNCPEDIDATLTMIKNKKTRLIDLGDVNGNIFINHAWLGFYYYLLQSREKHRAIIGSNRFFKLVFNVFNFFNVLPFYDLEFKADNQTMKRTTCLVYIGNNDQSTNIQDFSDRKSLSLGLLAIYVCNCKTRWELFKCMLSILNNSFETSPYVTKFMTDDLIINSKYKLINTVIDGELLKLETPLHYTIHKRQLKVYIP